MENNTFYGNSSVKQGGALAFFGYGSNKIYANMKNSLFVDNIPPLAYPNTAGLANNGTAKTYNLGGNIGYDNNTVPEEGTTGTALDVFGTDTPTLHANSSNVKAGYNGTFTVPTLIIIPDSVADNFGVENDLLTDARGFVRSATAKDSGAVEIGFLAFDANGGIFTNETPVTEYNGTQHTILNDDGAVTKVYTVSNIDGTGISPTAPSLPDGNPFRGWSLTAGGPVLTESELQVQLGKLTSGVTLFAVYAISSTVTVHYIDELGAELVGIETLNGYVGDPYSTQTMAIDGHTLKTTPDNATGLFAVENIDVTYIYSANPATVTVHYVDENGNALASPGTENGFFGTDYSTLPIDIVGHTLKTTPDNATGLFAVGNIDVTYIYEKVEEPTTEEPTTEEPTTTERTTVEPTTEKPITGEPKTSKPATDESTTNAKGTDTPNTGDTGITVALTAFALTAVLIGIMSARKRKEESN